MTESRMKYKVELHKKQRSTEAAKAAKREKRRRRKANKPPTERAPQGPKGRGPPLPIPTSVKPLSHFPVVSTCYTGEKGIENALHGEIWTLEMLVARGLEVFEWDGRYVQRYPTYSVHKPGCLLYRTPYAILDDERRIIAVLAGRPFPKNGVPDDWDDVVARACAAIEAAREEMIFEKKDLEHRRGPHIGKAFGWSHGTGQEVCISDSLHHRGVTNRFNSTP